MLKKCALAEINADVYTKRNFKIANIVEDSSKINYDIGLRSSKLVNGMWEYIDLVQ